MAGEQRAWFGIWAGPSDAIPCCFCKCVQRYENRRDAEFLMAPVCVKCAQVIEPQELAGLEVGQDWEAFRVVKQGLFGWASGRQRSETRANWVAMKFTRNVRRKSASKQLSGRMDLVQLAKPQQSRD